MLLLSFALSWQAAMGTPTAELIVSRAKTILRDLGVPGPLRLQSVVPGQNVPNSSGGAVVTDRNKYTYNFYLKGSGAEPFAIVRGNEGDDLMRGRQHPLTNKGLEAKVVRWASKMAGKESTKLVSIDSDGKVGQARFAILRNGYPFVASSEQYGYTIGFSDPDGQFLRYTSVPDPPPVSLDKPVLDEKRALKVFDKAFQEEIASPLLAEHHWKRVWYTLISKPELGYYLPPGQKVARLVWRIPSMQNRDVGYAVQGGSNASLIDAISGHRYPTNVVP